MESPNMPSISIDPPRSVERRRRGRGVDVMTAMPTPERPQHHHLPTPVTQRRRTDGLDPSDKNTAIHLPTPQTLPRKRASPSTVDPTSPSGHTSFFFAAQSGATESADRVPPRRRPGLMFAQQMGLTAQTASIPASAEIKFGGRLGVGVGMGGVMRSSPHGPVDKVSLENPFLVHHSSSSTNNSLRTVNPSPDMTGARPAPPAPGAETSYVPQALRPSAERSLSPHPRRRPRHPGASSPTRADMLVPGGAGPSSARAKRQQMIDEDNPFIAKPGEVVRPRPTREDNPQVTYVFRGSKKVFANPFFPPETSYPASELDPTHPDFDPHPCPKPRLLFPTPAAPAPAPETPQQQTSRTLGGFASMDVDHGPLSDDDFVAESAESEDEEELPARRGMLFGPGSGMKRDREGDFEARKRARV